MNRLLKPTFMAVILMLFSIITFSGCGRIYKCCERDGFRFTLFPGSGKAIVDCWEWDGNKDNMEITIPDTCDGYQIVQLGGYIGYGPPGDFQIYMPRTWRAHIITSERLEMEEPYEIVELDFIVNIGKNVTKIEQEIPTRYSRCDNADGSYTYYRVYAYVNCSEENPAFYSEDGRLYHRETGELVNKFLYR